MHAPAAERLAILHVVNELHDVSYNRIILSLARGLPRDTYELHVGCIKDADGPMRELLSDEGVQVTNFARGASPPSAVRAVVRYVRERGIDVVHTHVLRSDLTGGLAARLAGGVRLISTKHNFGYVPGQTGWLHRSVFYWPAMFLPDHVVVVTDAHRRFAIESLHMRPGRISTVHNGIDPDAFYRPQRRRPGREALGLAPEDVAAIYAGRLVTGKGLEDLLHALSRASEAEPRLRLLIAGEGPLRAPLERLAGDLRLAGRVTFLGFRRDMPELLAAADVAVLPSLSEGLPLSLIEAMAAGVPVVATPVGGIPELIEDGVSGLLVPPGNVPTLAEALAGLAADEGARARLAAAGQGVVRRGFSTASMVQAYERVYREQSLQPVPAG